MYLETIIQKYKQRSIESYNAEILDLKIDLERWASSCFISILDSGSREKGTAISKASDVDYLVSLKSTCNYNNGGIKSIYDELYDHLKKKYKIVRKQNVSFRITIRDLEVDITPARRHSDNSNDHWLYESKKDSIKQTNIEKHINDISTSGRLNEIKLLKVWRELNFLDFPSIYLEYLVLRILFRKSKDASNLSDNFIFLLNELSKDISNPLYFRIEDPANSNNILSNILLESEKKAIIAKAKISIKQEYWHSIVW